MTYMNIPDTPDHELEKRLSARLLDVFIRAGLVLAMTMLCYKIFAPFLPLMLWALILAVTMYPIHRQSRQEAGWKAGTYSDPAGIAEHCGDRRADLGAGQLAWRFDI